VFRGYQHLFCKATRNQIGLFEAATHRIAAVAAIMTAIAGNMVGHNDPVTDLKWADAGSDPHHLAGNFMP
jgi:hypothetical protein